ncbi:MAG: ribokinase [Fimbriimonadaceae bacterium]|nr:ribokinase [Fimbriimonadaceae bacterium]
MNSARVLVVGSANMDLVARVPRFPKPGETLFGTTFATFSGGKGANQAVAVGRLGGPISFVGCVGNDEFGRSLLESLRESGADCSLVETVPTSTGTAIILVDDRAENQIVVISGANGCVRPEAVASAVESVEPAVALFQLEIPLEAVSAGLRRAKAMGATTVLNPAPAQPLDDAVLANVDVLTPNQTEAALLVGRDGAPEDLCDALLALGVGTVAMTLGASGSLVATRAGKVHVPSIRVEAVDTTAAGDAFNGALALFLAQGEPLEHSVALANRAGALAATRHGAQASLPSLAELRAVL